QDVVDGTIVSNQAVYTCDQLPGPVPSDDPTTAAPDDPTQVRVVAAPLFINSRKEVIDLDGGLVEPGDVLEYTILVINNGSQASNTTIVRDSVPARASYVPGSTVLNGSPIADQPGGSSPLISGLSVKSARPGTPDGVLWVDDGSGTSDAVAVVNFRVRVEASGVVCGAAISNQAWIWCDRTDPYGTNIAEVTVGDCPNLNRTVKSWLLVEDNGAPGVIDPGDVVAYQILIENSGATSATDIVFSDTIPAGTSYQFGTLSLDDLSLTDLADGDPGEVVANTISVRVAELEPSASARIGFQVRIEQGPRIVNQGLVSSAQLPDEPTDDDGDELNGDNPTVIQVGVDPQADLSTSVKSVEDLNGGVVLPGDELRYTIRLVNAGTADANSIRVTDTIPENTEYIPASLEKDGRSLTDAFDNDEGDFASTAALVTFILDSLPAGETALLSFRVRVNQSAELGTVIDNFARIVAQDIVAFDSNHVSVVVGGGPGAGGVRGRVFIDLGERNGVFDENRDEILAGYQVILKTPDPNGQGSLVASAISDDQGRFYLMDLEPGSYSLTAFSPSGVEYVRSELEGQDAIVSDRVNDKDLPVDPSGRIYESSSGTLRAGTVVSLFYDEENSLLPGEKVPLENLPFPS
ncbi:MAG: DUF11 domain-containing protein, partial [Deltaproteobacteria bacterium]|nr:DUF11 domain-containing protein [Deltaproteobacteria bacterium]